MPTERPLNPKTSFGEQRRKKRKSLPLKRHLCVSYLSLNSKQFIYGIKLWLQELNGNSETVKQEEDGPFGNVEYVIEQLDVKDPALVAFSDIFARFQAPQDYAEVRHVTSTHSLP